MFIEHLKNICMEFILGYVNAISYRLLFLRKKVRLIINLAVFRTGVFLYSLLTFFEFLIRVALYY